MIQPIDQNPAGLSLAVFAGTCDHPFTILRQVTATLGDWTFTFHVIGESHLVTAALDGVIVFSELLACVDVPMHRCVHHHRFHDLAAHRCAQPGYAVEVAVENGLPESTVAGNDAQRIEVQFPQTAGQMPFTRIEWQRVGHILRWQTLHVYPQEGGVLVCVRSASHFDTIKAYIATHEGQTVCEK